MKIALYLISFILCYHASDCVQPYFPSQIVFSPDNGLTTIAIDEINQRAYQKVASSSPASITSYVMKHFPYAIPDSPQSKYYVQLLVEYPPLNCLYGTYWTYGGSIYDSFPSHWSNGTSFEIKNYMEFYFPMIYSNGSSPDEDYWHSNITCRTDSGQTYPCEEIYFKKNTEIPLRLTRVGRAGWTVRQFTTVYKVISTGEPDEKYFDSIPQEWPSVCRDTNLGILYYPQTSKIDLKQSSQVQVWLTTPPHRINGNDSLEIQWKPTDCIDCFTWTTKQLIFHSENFHEKQTLTITRVKDGPKTTLIPSFNGGGFDVVSTQLYPIYIE